MPGGAWRGVPGGGCGGYPDHTAPRRAAAVAITLTAAATIRAAATTRAAAAARAATVLPTTVLPGARLERKGGLLAVGGRRGLRRGARRG